jgi:hypothetical protein
VVVIVHEGVVCHVVLCGSVVHLVYRKMEPNALVKVVGR